MKHTCKTCQGAGRVGTSTADAQPCPTCCCPSCGEKGKYHSHEDWSGYTCEDCEETFSISKLMGLVILIIPSILLGF